MDNAALIQLFEPWARSLFAQRSGTVTCPDLSGAAPALLAWAMARVYAAPVVLVADGPRALETVARDTAALAPPAGTVYTCLPREADHSAADIEALDDAGDRNRALTALLTFAAGNEAPPPVLVTCVQALLQAMPPPSALTSASIALTVGNPLEREAVLAAWVDYGYEPAPEVERKGQFAVRGGLLDVWPVQETWPFRLELMGDTLESLRSFDPATQRSRQHLALGTVTPTGAWEAARVDGASEEGRRYDITDYAPDGTLWISMHADTHEANAELYAQTLTGTPAASALRAWLDIRRSITAQPSWRCLDFVLDSELAAAAHVPDFSGFASPSTPGGGAVPDGREAFRQRLTQRAFKLLADGGQAVFLFDTPGGLEHFEKEVAALRATLNPIAAQCLQLRLGAVSEGFFSQQLGLMLVAEADLYGRALGRRATRATRASRQRVAAGERLGAWSDIEPGNLVVHVEHGIGRYLGLNSIEFHGEPQDVLTVEYADGAKLHVPVAQAHVLSRYAGLSRKHAVLHRLGGKTWRKNKAAAQQAIIDMAAQLLETQARRRAHEGHAFCADHPWMREFEASFPYDETPDQAQAIAEIKADMASPRPMDRLLCGDAGYGKTEVAMRAAFKAALEGMQTAVLVPTTVLAQQHYEVFRERMAPYPMQVAMLSRFCSRTRQAATLTGLADGTVDIVIGTHALLQASVRFKDLGLVVIDEEQRFGVRHKEWFKHLRSQVDVLTLTATPIPRTLYMSLTGARDMSLIQTPPSERLAVETRVAQNTDAVVRAAILRELHREGQVFYLHNRVMTIERVRQRLARAVPEARLIVAHGQMPAAELASGMRRFAEREFDVLVCTTIVESGLDMPSVNTILIDRADRFGLADLYQLRGRVGRGRHQAYAYLLLPPQGVADAEARQRIKALTDHTRLGEGFKLAVRDLEIRGSGNVLGSQQSGHIAAIGFDLYCQMLRRSVAELKQEPLPPVADAELVLDFMVQTPAATADQAAAYIPHAYIEDERLRIQAYRRLAEASTDQDLVGLNEEWRDRFGPPPQEAARLFALARIRIGAAQARVQKVETRGERVIAMRRGMVVKPNGRFPLLTATEPDVKLRQIADLLQEL